MSLGGYEEPPCWNALRGVCVICRRLLVDGDGLFCANYSSRRGIWTPCQQAWCGPCYTITDGGIFPIALPEDEGGLILDDLDEKGRYLCARNGDNLICPFQCDECHFQNLTGRSSQILFPKDQRLLKYIRRAQLDAFWATEPNTVGRNLMELRRGSQIAHSMGFGTTMFPAMGPFPVEDVFGMGAAIVMLDLSLRPGINDKTVQFNTVRKFRSAFSNLRHASARGLEGSTMSNGVKKLTITNCPTYGDWFTRFNKGCHKRMGDVVCPDRALSVPIVIEFLRQLDLEWDDPLFDKFKVASEGAFYVIGFCCGLRGEEIPKADLQGILRHWEESGRSNPMHVVVALLGRFKGETGLRYHLMPVVARTKSGIEPRKWIGRLLGVYQTMGICHGPFFRSGDGERMRLRDANVFFFSRLEKVQLLRPDLIGLDVEVEEVYGISRSLRRGSTSRASDMGLSPDIIDSNNRWRKFERARGMQPSLNMREHYTDVLLSIRQLLRYSEAM